MIFERLQCTHREMHWLFKKYYILKGLFVFFLRDFKKM